LGSIVQKGKFAACAAAVRVSALNRVDLPTFGKPTIPILNPMTRTLSHSWQRRACRGRRATRQERGAHASVQAWLIPPRFSHKPESATQGQDKMTRIDQTFAKLKSEGRKAFVAYIMGGDPDLATSLAVMMGLPAAGVDIIELGVPFTDPMADGPTIQLAGQRALEGGHDAGKDAGHGAPLPRATPPRRSC
jgi:hypothetical protein